MRIEKNHDGHEMVVRVFSSKGEPTSAYIVVSRENLQLFGGVIFDEVEKHLDSDDEKPF